MLLRAQKVSQAPTAPRSQPVRNQRARPSIENDRYDPSLVLALRISDLFGVSIHELFLYEEEGSEGDGGEPRKLRRSRM